MSVLSQFFSQASKLIPIEVLVIGGGGGARGANSTALGYAGAGAGLFVYDNVFAIAGIPYTINIGAGGAGGITIGSNGNPTNIPGLGINAFGGQGTTTGSVIYTGCAAGGTGSTFSDTVIVSDKIISSNVGGSDAPTTGNGGAGGGGSFSAGNASPQPLNAGGSGGNGLECNCIGYPTLILGGGGSGGNGNAGPFTPTQGGAGGGGAGGAKQGSGSNGTANTGGGGGGGGGSSTTTTTGGSGGSGVVYIRYPTAYSAATVTGNTPATPQSGYYVYQWNSGPGSITFN